MEKYLLNYKPKEVSYPSTLELLNDEPLVEPIKAKPFILGFLGNSSDAYWNRETVVEQIVHPIIGEQDRLPTTLLLPSEGATSLLLESWADRQDIFKGIYDADWAKLGKRARALRDARIIKESTHLVLFLGKSDYYEKIAIREVKKGKIVYCVAFDTHELTEYT